MSIRRTKQFPKPWTTGIIAVGLALQVGCDLTNREFREAAGPALQNGLTQIVNGVLDGLFAVIEPDPDTDADKTIQP